MWAGAVAASIRPLGLTGLHARPRPAKRGGYEHVAHEDTATASGIKVPLIACGSVTLPSSVVRKAGDTFVPCAMRALAKSLDAPWVSSNASTWLSPCSIWLRPAAAASPAVLFAC